MCSYVKRVSKSAKILVVIGLLVLTGLVTFGQPVFAGGSIAEGHSCSASFTNGSPAFKKGWKCVPDYVQQQPYDRCRGGGNAKVQSVGWFVPKVDDNYEPWTPDRSMSSSSASNDRIPLALFATRYVCDNKEGAATGSGTHYVWLPHNNVTLGGRGSCKETKTTSNCGSGSGLCWSRYYKEIYASKESKSAGHIISSSSAIMQPVRGVGTSSKGYFSGIAGNGHYEGLSLKVKEFKAACVNANNGNGTAGICTKAESGTYAVTIAGTPYRTNNSACGNLTPSTSLIAGVLPSLSITVSPFPMTSVDKTNIYAGQTTKFTHSGRAEIAIEGTLTKDIVVSFSKIDGPGATKNLGTQNMGSVTLNAATTKGSVEDAIDSFTPTSGDVGKKVCRQVKWTYTDLSGTEQKGYSDEKCTTISAPPCKYSIYTSVAGPGEVVVNRFKKGFSDSDYLGGKFTHKIDYDITSTEANHQCKINPGSFNAWVDPAVPKQLLNLAGILPTKNTKSPDYTNTLDSTLGWLGFQRTAINGTKYCEYNRAVSTNFYDGAVSTWPQASGCATARRDNYNLTVTADPIVNNNKDNGNVAQPGFPIKFQHNIKASKALTDKFNVSLQQTVVNINTDPGSGSSAASANNIYVYPYYSNTDIDGAGEKSNDLWWNNDGEAGTTTVNNDHLGKKICQRLVTKESANLGNVGGNKTGEWYCVLVPHQYKLTPSVVVNNENANTPVVPGAVIPITGSVNNAGPTKSKDTQWVLSRFILEPGQTLESPGIAGRNYTIGSQLITSLSPSQFFNHRGYKSQQSNNRVFDFGDVSNFVTDTFTIPNTAKIGEKYCFSLSVQPHSSNHPAGTNDNHWRHARPICVVVSKHPLTQVHGAGLILPQGATKGYLTINPSDNSQYGSWMEYDILSGNLTTPADEFVASNAGHLINLGTASKDKWHQLTFANTPIYGKFGTNLPANRAQSLFSYYSGIAKTSANTIAKPAGDVVLHNLSYPSTIHYMSNIGGTLTLSGQLPNHKSLIVIQDGGNVVINGNITYQNQGGFSKASDFSQLIIIVRNGNIIINENVTQVDAWLVATGNNPNRGRLKTCNKTDDKVSMHDCVELLTVNGPVIVDYVDLLRTRGNDIANNTLGQPAEVFNFRPDSYLWAIGRSPELPVFETTHTKDLPPRY